MKSSTCRKEGGRERGGGGREGEGGVKKEVCVAVEEGGRSYLTMSAEFSLSSLLFLQFLPHFVSLFGEVVTGGDCWRLGEHAHDLSCRCFHIHGHLQ